MIKKFVALKIFLLILINTINAQVADLNSIKQNYESFEYAKVIALSEELIKTGILSENELVSIYVMRAVSFYSLGNETMAKESFIDALKLNKNYSPDPSVISPKIISLFNEVKTNFLKSLSPVLQKDTVAYKSPTKIFDTGILRNAALRNIALPGWGHFYSGNTTKGIIYTALSAATLGSAIYFIGDTNNKEKLYIQEKNLSIINQRYENYNNSYKTRNVLLIAYAAVWIVSQLDLIVWSDEDLFIQKNNLLNNASNLRNDIEFSFRLPLN